VRNSRRLGDGDAGSRSRPGATRRRTHPRRRRCRRASGARWRDGTDTAGTDHAHTERVTLTFRSRDHPRRGRWVPHGLAPPRYAGCLSALNRGVTWRRRRRAVERVPVSDRGAARAHPPSQLRTTPRTDRIERAGAAPDPAVRARSALRRSAASTTPATEAAAGQRDLARWGPACRLGAPEGVGSPITRHLEARTASARSRFSSAGWSWPRRDARDRAPSGSAGWVRRSASILPWIDRAVESPTPLAGQLVHGAAFAVRPRDMRCWHGRGRASGSPSRDARRCASGCVRSDSSDTMMLIRSRQSG
jgi:hypothetical protein